jgi:1L-myo-inositol 1-phosphate cytidylyltransferase / CDP-L-myo-inositol myo-inositolphosphotransferase
MAKRQVITFGSTGLAQYLVAGVPACARASMIASSRALQANDVTTISIPGGRLDDARCLAELERFCPNGFAIVDGRDLSENDNCVPGEALIISAAAESRHIAPEGAPGVVGDFYSSTTDARLRDELRRAGWGLLKATGKAGDGIVSRHINRHISMQISAVLLRFAWVRPGHATLLTAITAAAMFVALLSGTQGGLMAGAILFQIASIVDGVDGEIARVTLRASAQGATLDTITDGFTNVGFIIGLAVNLAIREEYLALEIGMLGATSLALGCAILAAKAVRDGDAVTFNAVINWLRRQSGSAQNLLIAIAKRDFFALASMIMILASFDLELLLILSASFMIWLALVIYVSIQAKTDDLSV